MIRNNICCQKEGVLMSARHCHDTLCVYYSSITLNWFGSGPDLMQTQKKEKKMLTAIKYQAL